MGGRARGVLLAGLLLAGCGESDGGRPSRSEDAYGHLEALASWPHRRAGTAEIREAADYVAWHLRGAGYRVEVQEFPFPYYRLGSFAARARGRTVPSFPVFYSGSTPESGVTGTCVDPAEVEISGKIVLADAAHIEQNMRRAEEEGAAGLVVSTRREPIYTQDRLFAVRLGTRDWETTPVPALVVEGAQDLVGEEVTLRNSSVLERGVGRNVVGWSGGGEDGYLLVTAHLDSWFQGIVDDGTGVAVLLDVAKRLARWDEPVGLVFLVADCEELGLIGSSVFARRLEGRRILAVLELDMVSAINGYGRGGMARTAQSIPPFLVHTANLAPWVALFDEALPGASIPFPALVTDWIFGIRSDYEWFWGQGIPGLFVNTLFREYHTEDDSLDLVDPENLRSVAGASEAFLETLAREAAHVGSFPHFEADLVLTEEAGRLKARLDLANPAPFASPAVKFRFYRDNGFEETIVPERTGPRTYSCLYEPLGSGSYSVRADIEGLRTGTVQAEVPWP